MPVSDQGPLHGRYMLIPRTLLFVTHAGRVLLLKGASGKRLWANRYNGVGGHLEQGEDVLTAARRELIEETGLRVDDLRLCGTIIVDTGERVGIGIYVLRGEFAGPVNWETTSTPDGVLEWVPFEQVFTLPLVEDLPVLLPRVLAMRLGDQPFSARYAYDSEQNMIVTFGDGE